jgi:nucleotide-binding universal stress UspA family protein
LQADRAIAEFHDVALRQRKKKMSDFKKIMVALASSEHAGEIFDYAAKMATAMGADLLAVNVINSRDVEAVQTISSMGYDVNGEHYVQNIKQERTATLDGIIERSGFPKKRVHTAFPIGNPADELLQTAIRENVDMIVMGIKGRSNLEYMFVGSVAEKIFQRSPVPVVSFRDRGNAERLRNRIHPR